MANERYDYALASQWGSFFFDDDDKLDEQIIRDSIKRRSDLEKDKQSTKR